MSLFLELFLDGLPFVFSSSAVTYYFLTVENESQGLLPKRQTSPFSRELSKWYSWSDPEVFDPCDTVSVSTIAKKLLWRPIFWHECSKPARGSGKCTDQPVAKRIEYTATFTFVRYSLCFLEDTHFMFSPVRLLFSIMKKNSFRGIGCVLEAIKILSILMRLCIPKLYQLLGFKRSTGSGNCFRITSQLYSIFFDLLYRACIKSLSGMKTYWKRVFFVIRKFQYAL